VRRAFASTTSAPAYGYDPYGNALQSTIPLTDFGYAGMFYSADSGLYLTLYRAYDPAVGRWLSRDPIGEMGREVDSTRLNSFASGLEMTALPTTTGGSSRSDGSSNPFKLNLGINTFATAVNLYTYVENNPISRWDIHGLCDSDPPPISDQPPIVPINWVRRCILALALCATLDLTPHEPDITDAAPDPRPPVLTIVPRK
jgi:RHS repeat-associated protein